MSKTVMLICALTWTTAAVSASDVQPAAFQPQLKMKLSATDIDGALLFRAPNYPEPFYLAFGRVRESGLGRSDVLLPSRGPSRTAADGTRTAGPPVLHAVRMKPGRYLLTTYNHNAQCEACLARGTIAFTVLRGQAVYIGELDFEPVRSSIFTQATSRGQEKVAHIYALNRYYDSISRPLMKTSGTADLEQTKLDARHALPRLTAPIVAGALEYATFGEGQAKPTSC